MNQIPRQVSLSQSEKAKLNQLCNNRMNWSDGGYWQGVGREPNCMAFEQHESRQDHTINFPTDASANKWNSEWESMIRAGGYGASAAIAYAVYSLSTGGVGAVVGFVLGVFQSEIQAGISYPKVNRGWSYQVITSNKFKWSAHPMGQKFFAINSRVVVRNHEGKVVADKATEQRYNIDDLPQGLAKKIASAPNKTYSTNY